ncbi:MAG: FKBP-type peptidyl-prolyl cis-trans isomerase [Bacteroidales bacterium]|nr:FKBP-type peptidyl-prolyl cis-trans isomerase [Bacteroidales bacterium]
MKKIIKTIAYIVMAVAAASCARTVEPGANEASKRYFDAWMQIHHPDAKPTGLGIYVIEDEPGTGAVVTDEGFVYADYIVTDLEGNITSYTDRNTAKQLGKFDTTAFYGPKVITTMDNTIQAGLADAIVGMKVGGHKKVIIPSWLMTYSVYDTPEEYLNTSSSYSDAIYDITITDFTEDISKYEIERIGNYLTEHKDEYGNMSVADSLQYGFYYKELVPPTDTTSFPTDTSIYINYTGRLLSGLVFDTTDERTAKDHDIYSSSRSYEPVKIKWGEKYSDLKMGSSGSSVVSGFALTLWQMRAFEKGVGIFYSPLGYSYNGSGSSIPSYSPLVFEIEIVAEPED